jgi:hypothetical protein
MTREPVPINLVQPRLLIPSGRGLGSYVSSGDIYSTRMRQRCLLGHPWSSWLIPDYSGHTVPSTWRCLIQMPWLRPQATGHGLVVPDDAFFPRPKRAYFTYLLPPLVSTACLPPHGVQIPLPLADGRSLYLLSFTPFACLLLAECFGVLWPCPGGPGNLKRMPCATPP